MHVRPDPGEGRTGSRRDARSGDTAASGCYRHPPMATGRKKSKKKASRRRNYEPVVEETGLQKFTPTGWANWMGFVLFSILGVATAVETVIAATTRSDHTDWIVAGVMAVLCVWMAILFAITHWKDYI